MSAPTVITSTQLQQLSLQQKYQYIQNAKQETEYLQQQIQSIKAQTQNTSIVDVSRNVSSFTHPPRFVKASNAFKGHRGKIQDMKLFNDSSALVSVGQDGILLVWDAESGMKVNAIGLKNCWVLGCAVSPTGRIASVGGLDNICTIYNIADDDDESEVHSPASGNFQMNGLWTQTPRAVLKGHKGYISSMVFPQENQLLSASGDMSVAYWDLNKHTRISEFVDRNLGDVNSVVSHPSNPNIFVSGSLKTAKVWDTRVPISTQEFTGHEDDINVVRQVYFYFTFSLID